MACHKHSKTLSRDQSELSSDLSDDNSVIQHEAMMKRALSHADDQVRC